MFNKQGNNAHILYNAIDVDQFSFNQSIRDLKRAALNVEDKLVLGHVGRFENPKNHTFLIDIFAEVKKTKK